MNWRLQLAKTALIIIDAQEEILSRMSEKETLEKNLHKLIEAFTVLELPVYFTELEGQGTTPKDLKQLAPKAKTFFRPRFSAGEFAGEIPQQNLILAGVETHISIRQTAYDLHLKDKSISLVVDAIASKNPFEKDITLSDLRADKFLLTTVETCLMELLEDTKNPKFKTVAKILK